MVGAMALIQDDHGRVLVLEHTYRREIPWGLPGGWLKHAESPEAGLAREVFEETGFRIRVEQLLAADFWGSGQLDLLYRCTIESGTYQQSDETARHQWLEPSQLPELLPNQIALLRKAALGVGQKVDGVTAELRSQTAEGRHRSCHTFSAALTPLPHPLQSPQGALGGSPRPGSPSSTRGGSAQS